MKKGSWTQHPIFGVVRGFAIAAIYIAFEKAISPAMFEVFGASWQWMKLLLFYFLLGLFTKWLLWRALPSNYRIEAMPPADFAGVSQAAMLRAASQVRAPLPEIGAPKAERGTFALDFAQLDARSRELENLGFALQAEGVAHTDKKAAPTFARIYRHDEGSWAEVFQSFPRGMAPTPLHFALLTYFEDDWVCGDSTMKANWLLWMMRRPRSIGKYHDAETPAAQLWQSHRERSAKLHQKLGVRILPLDLDGFLAHGARLLKESRNLLLRRSILVSMLRAKFAKRGREDWREVDKHAKA